MSYQQITIVGNVGSEPKVHCFEDSGNWSIQFSVAASKRWKNKDGNVTEKTTWFRCNRITTSEKLATHIKVGMKLMIVGEVKASAYIRDGVAVPTLEIDIDKLVFLDKKAEGNFTPSTTPADVSPDMQGGEDDLPF